MENPINLIFPSFYVSPKTPPVLQHEVRRTSLSLKTVNRGKTEIVTRPERLCQFKD